MELKFSPPAYSSVNSFLTWVFYDAHATDPATYPDYKYVGEVWIDGVKVHTERAYPRPVGSFGFFDFSAVIRGYVAATFAPPAVQLVAWSMLPGQWATAPIIIKIREEYSGETGAVVFEDEERQYFNHYNGRISSFTNLQAYADSAATNRPRQIRIGRNAEYYFLPVYTNVGFDVVLGNVPLVSSDTINVLPDAAPAMTMLNISIPALQDAYEGAGADFAPVQNFTLDISGVRYEVEIICDGLYPNYMLHFMNKLGGFDTMLFNKPRHKTLANIEKKEYQQLPYRIDSFGNISVAGPTPVMHEQRTVFASKFEEKLRLQTDLLSDGEYAWLAELAASPWLYLTDVDGVMYPVTLSGSTYDIKEYMSDRLTFLTIDLEFSGSQNTQFR